MKSLLAAAAILAAAVSFEVGMRMREADAHVAPAAVSYVPMVFPVLSEIEMCICEPFTDKVPTRLTISKCPLSLYPFSWLAKRILYSVRLPTQVLIHPASIFFSFTKLSIDCFRSWPGFKRKAYALGIESLFLQDAMQAATHNRLMINLIILLR